MKVQRTRREEVHCRLWDALGSFHVGKLNTGDAVCFYLPVKNVVNDSNPSMKFINNNQKGSYTTIPNMESLLL